MAKLSPHQIYLKDVLGVRSVIVPTSLQACNIEAVADQVPPKQLDSGSERAQEPVVNHSETKLLIVVPENASRAHVVPLVEKMMLAIELESFEIKSDKALSLTNSNFPKYGISFSDLLNNQLKNQGTLVGRFLKVSQTDWVCSQDIESMLKGPGVNEAKRKTWAQLQHLAGVLK